MSHLAISLLGPFQVTLDGQLVASFKSNQVRVLLAYLAVEADQPHSRQMLAELLWPERPEREALANLRYALSNLRQAIGDRTADPPFLLISRDTLQFNIASDYSFDVVAFERHIADSELANQRISELALSLAEGVASRRVGESANQRACPEPSRRIGDLQSAIRGQPEVALRSAIHLCRGRFLEGFQVKDSPAFEGWMLLKREQFNRHMLDALYRLAAIHEERGEYAETQTYARRQLELEAWREEAHRQLMRALALSGQRSAALAQYETCCRMLAEELDVVPADETIALYERIRDGELDKETRGYPQDGGSRGDWEVRRLGDWEVGRLGEGSSPHPLTPSPFVGRERELAKLDGFLETALGGHAQRPAEGRVVFVTGEAGSGKTALVGRFARRAMETRGDVVVALGSCNAQAGIGDLYLPFREILRMLSGDIETKRAVGDITPEHARRLSALSPETAQALVEAGPDLIDLFVPGEALVKCGVLRGTTDDQGPTTNDELEGSVRRAATSNQQPATSNQQADLFEQVTNVLRSLARQHPLVLVLDDLQWADNGSAGLLFHLGRRLAGSRILIVGAYRSGEVALGCNGERPPLAPIVNEFRRDFGDILVDLDQAEGWRFVEAILDSQPNRLGPAFRERLVRHTGGNPLFAVELLRDLQERGDLVRDEAGRWVEGASLDWAHLPARVEAVIAERVGRLPPDLQATLAVASVEGEMFTAEVVARVQGVDEEEMIRRLSGALSKQHGLVSAQGLDWLGGAVMVRQAHHEMVRQAHHEVVRPQAERPHHDGLSKGDALSLLKGETVMVRQAHHEVVRPQAERPHHDSLSKEHALSSKGVSRYRFRHAMFQRYLYNCLDLVERAHLHRAVGDALEALCKADGAGGAAVAAKGHIEAIAPRLAYHFEAAGLVDKAVDYYSLSTTRYPG